MSTAALAIGDRGADVSAHGRYRYSLYRRWDYGKPAVLFVMLNPSTADADIDDPTIRKCIGFARRWNMGGVRVCNLYPWRATNPKDLPSGHEVGGEHGGILPRNDYAILSAACDAGRIIAAWGANAGPWPMRSSHVMDLLRDRHVEALRLTKNGRPWHPLYVGYDAIPVDYGTCTGSTGVLDRDGCTGSSDAVQVVARAKTP